MILFLIIDCIIIGCSIVLLYYCKKYNKRFTTITKGISELKNTPRVETLQVFITKPMDYFSNNVSIGIFSKHSKEKIAEYFTQKLIEDNIIKINDRGDFYEATITIVKE